MTEEKVTDGDNFQAKILEVMSGYPKGISHEILQKSVPSLNAEQLKNTLQTLLNQKKLQLLQKGNQLVFKLINSVQKFQGGDIEEKLVFEAIERAGSDGIPARDLKFKCNLPQPQITKLLKSLEAKKSIKCVTGASRKKVFMLYDLEPSQTVTGGVFYTGQEFDSEFVEILGEQCYKYLLQAKGLAEKLPDPISQRNASYKSSRDICDYINGLKISKIKLSLKEIEDILESLIYDEKLEKSIPMSKSEKLYRVTKPLIANGGFMMVPCGTCQIYKDCRVGGDISPATCEYMKQWLDF